MKFSNAFTLATIAATASASTRFVLTTDHKGVDGRNVTVGPPSAIAGDLIGAFDGTSVSFDLVNGELRDSTGRDYGLALVGPTGGPYDLVGLASPATAAVPEGNVKIYDQWNLDFYLGYSAEQGWFYFIPTTEADDVADELLKIVFADRDWGAPSTVTELEPRDA